MATRNVGRPPADARRRYRHYRKFVVRPSVQDLWPPERK